MKMYIGNATKQIVDFCYRLPVGAGYTGIRSQQVPMGGQVCLSGEMNQEEIDFIIHQFSSSGLINVSEIGHGPDFHGICYSIDKPIAVKSIRELMDSNHEELLRRGEQIRREAAIAEHNRIETELGSGQRPATLNDFEMTVIQDNHDERDPVPPLAEEVHVRRQAPDTPPAAAQGRASRGRSRRSAA